MAIDRNSLAARSRSAASSTAAAPAGPGEPTMSFAQSATALCAAFQEETEHYERALRIARALPAAVQRGQDTEAQLQEIMTHLTDITRIEQRIAQPKHHWLQSNQEVTPALHAYPTHL